MTELPLAAYGGLFGSQEHIGSYKAHYLIVLGSPASAATIDTFTRIQNYFFVYSSLKQKLD